MEQSEFLQQILEQLDIHIKKKKKESRHRPYILYKN